MGRDITLSEAVIAGLKRYDSPTLANAIETFDIRPRSEGFTSSPVRAIFTDQAPVVGLAVTGKISSASPSTEGYSRRAWWEYVLSTPSPRIVVFEDIDDPPGLGAFWGEVNANIHRALGCEGVITNGSVRDLEEVHDLGFGYFAASVAVSHAYVRLVEFNVDVQVAGLTVKPGDLLHADRHGALSIPPAIAEALPGVAAELIGRERTVIEYCQSGEFDLDGLAKLVG